MGRKAGRSPEETRRAVLDAAHEAIRARGLDAPVEDIAHSAGVTRAGLLYHFAGKQKLLLALVTDLFDQLRALIERELDPEDDKPGRLTRAYIRAMLTPYADEAAERGTMIVLAQLLTVPAARELARVESEHLEQELNDDGLPRELVEFVVATADGASMAPALGGTLDPDRQARIEARLLSLTLDPANWNSFAQDCRI